MQAAWLTLGLRKPGWAKLEVAMISGVKCLNIWCLYEAQTPLFGQEVQETPAVICIEALGFFFLLLLKEER